MKANAISGSVPSIIIEANQSISLSQSVTMSGMKAYISGDGVIFNGGLRFDSNPSGLLMSSDLA
jgi:hypothetical protein